VGRAHGGQRKDKKDLNMRRHEVRGGGKSLGKKGVCQKRGGRGESKTYPDQKRKLEKRKGEKKIDHDKERRTVDGAETKKKTG